VEQVAASSGEIGRLVHGIRPLQRGDSNNITSISTGAALRTFFQKSPGKNRSDDAAAVVPKRGRHEECTGPTIPPLEKKAKEEDRRDRN
jgi:hypothetical protein